MVSIIKALIEGVAIAVAAFYIPQKQTSPEILITIALTAAASLFVLDQFAPQVSAGARQGTGFGIGTGMVGGQSGGLIPIPSGYQAVIDPVGLWQEPIDPQSLSSRIRETRREVRFT